MPHTFQFFQRSGASLRPNGPAPSNLPGCIAVFALSLVRRGAKTNSLPLPALRAERARQELCQAMRRESVIRTASWQFGSGGLSNTPRQRPPVHGSTVQSEGSNPILSSNPSPVRHAPPPSAKGHLEIAPPLRQRPPALRRLF